MLTFLQMFGIGLVTGSGVLLTIIAAYLPVVIPWKWYREGYKPVIPLVSEILDGHLIHRWIGSLSACFWMLMSLYLSIALFGACLLWILQWIGWI